MNQIDRLLKITIDNGASDLHLSSKYAPCLRIDGEMHFLKEEPILSSDDTDKMLRPIIPEKNRQEFEKDWDSDFSYSLEGIGRFRVNVFKDTHGTGAVFRTVPEKVPSIDDLGLSSTFSKTLESLCMHTKGLIIVTGPTGSGKSTTLAGMVDLINRTRQEHIITIEDPIEFMHESKGCLINQREIHQHTRGFSHALRAALREDPDIVMLGEMRDLETTEIALETAETGHLVFATLHTNTACSTVDRIIDKFPSGRQNQIRTLLANTLTAVVAQTLCKRKDGGRVVSAETLIATNAVRALIRDEKTHQLPTVIQVGANVGMQSYTDSLFRLVKDGIITSREAYLKAVDKDSLEQKFEEAGIEIDKSLVDIVQVDLSNVGPLSVEEMNSPEKLKESAWKLCTDKDTRMRDGQKAIELAQRAIDLGETSAESLMVLAAAQAQNENFRDAFESVKKAVQLAKADKDSDMLSRLKKQLSYYKKGLPLPPTS